jgi:hypothetical protein
MWVLNTLLIGQNMNLMGKVLSNKFCLTVANYQLDAQLELLIKLVIAYCYTRMRRQPNVKKFLFIFRVK